MASAGVDRYETPGGVRVALFRRFYGRDLGPMQMERIERALSSRDRQVRRQPGSRETRDRES